MQQSPYFHPPFLTPLGRVLRRAFNRRWYAGLRVFCPLCERAYRGWVFQVLYVGRVERDKGVIDMVEVATPLQHQSPHQVVWEVCGNGSALVELDRAVRARGSDNVFRLRGTLDRFALRDAYARTGRHRTNTK